MRKTKISERFGERVGGIIGNGIGFAMGMRNVYCLGSFIGKATTLAKVAAAGPAMTTGLDWLPLER